MTDERREQLIAEYNISREGDFTLRDEFQGSLEDFKRKVDAWMDTCGPKASVYFNDDVIVVSFSRPRTKTELDKAIGEAKRIQKREIEALNALREKYPNA